MGNIRLEPSSEATVQLSMPWLFLGRSIWIVITIIGIGTFLAGTPVHYRELLAICSDPECPPGQLSEGERQALIDSGLSLEFYATYHIVIQWVMMLGFASVGLLIFWRRSNELIALLMSLWLVTFGVSAQPMAAFGRAFPLWLPVTSLVDQLGWVILLPFFLYTFPDGRFNPPWTRLILIVFLGLGIVGNFIDALVPSLSHYAFIPQATWFIVMLTGIGMQVYRYRRVYGALQKQQTRWVVFGLMTTGLGLTVWVLISETGIPLRLFGLSPPQVNLVETTFVTAIFIVIALAIGVSIMRYRLWDVDVIIRKTLTYSLLTILLLLVYGGLIVLLQRLFRSTTGQDSPLAIVLSTLGIAALFAPLRSRVQAIIDRRFFRSQYDAQEILDALSERLRDEVDIDELQDALLYAVTETMKPSHVSIWMKPRKNG